SGAHIWSQRFPNLVAANSPSYNGGKVARIDGSGNVSVFGEFTDAVNLGGGMLAWLGCGGSCGYGGYLAEFAGASGSPNPPPTPTGAQTNTPTPTPTRTPPPTATPTSISTPTPPAANNFFTIAPCRILDTRNPNGPSGGPALSPGTARTFPVTGLCNVPPSAKAVAIMIAVVSPGDAGCIRLYPAGVPVPLASAINFRAGVIRANNGTYPVGTGGQMTALLELPVGSTATTDVFIDVYGYFR